MAVIDGYEPFVGQHCETSTTGNLLGAAGLELSEPMLYGMGEGLSYGVLVFKSMGAPFIGGRPRPEALTRTLAKHLGLEVGYRQTRSKKRAWDNVASFIDAGQPVAVKLNMRFLDYVNSEVDFAGHYVAMYGYDADTVFVVDTDQQGGPQVTGRHSFEAGRLWKGSMSSNAMTWTINGASTDIDWPRVLQGAISANMRDYLHPPIANFGAKGIRKTAELITGWYGNYAAEDLAHIGLLMERGGTGGGLFRYMYADFLRGAASHLDDDRLLHLADRFDAAGRLWTEIAGHIEGCAAGGAGRLEAAADLLLEVADSEEAAVSELADVMKETR